MELHVSQLYTCSYKSRHNTICLMFQPQQRLASPRVVVPFTAVWLNLPWQVNKSDVFPTHHAKRQDHVVHHGRLFFFLQFPSLFPQITFMKCLPEDLNCDQRMPQKSVLISIFCSESSTGRNHLKFRLLILGSISSDIQREASYLVWCVNCRESVHKKPHRSIQQRHESRWGGSDCAL